MTEKNDSRKFVANTAWLISQQVYTMLVSLIIGALTARYLGPGNLGLINYGAALVQIFSTACQLGLGNVLVAELVRQPSRRGALMGAALTIRLAASFVSIGCVIAIIRVIEPGNTLLLTVTALQAVSILFQTYEIFNFYFQSQLQSKFYVWAVMLATTVVGVWRVYLLTTGKPVEWFAVSSSINAFVILAFTCAVFFFVVKEKLRVRIADMRFLLINSYHFIIPSIASILYQQMDRLMIGKMIGETAVGLYSAAATIAVLWEFVPMAAINSASPLIYKTFERDRPEALRQMQMLFCGLTVLGVAVAVFFTVFGKYFIYLLYGAAFEPSVALLPMLVWGACFSIMSCVMTIWIIANKLNRYKKYYICLGALVNFSLNALWIPRHGAAGAALATMITQAVVLFSPLLFAQTRPAILLFLRGFAHMGELKGYVARYIAGRKGGSTKE